MTDLTATTRVTVEVSGRRPTIADMQVALDILAAEGIPSTFDIHVDQRTGREYIEGVPVDERPMTFTLSVTAERAAAVAATTEEAS
ncbi:hypothetical protein [Nocardioides soli]|uniref:Uncharacterized protein n=1 Tax=Nocardioides soli TaxID=1036020 RepID=A0A7W4VSL9_9ACTN|nr:hypothetical protein [Nocardioides soli]MBB3041003.1 hypothetical protein [Nocardioides soli]